MTLNTDARIFYIADSDLANFSGLFKKVELRYFSDNLFFNVIHWVMFYITGGKECAFYKGSCGN